MQNSSTNESRRNSAVAPEDDDLAATWIVFLDPATPTKRHIVEALQLLNENQQARLAERANELLGEQRSDLLATRARLDRHDERERQARSARLLGSTGRA